MGFVRVRLLTGRKSNLVTIDLTPYGLGVLLILYGFKVFRVGRLILFAFPASFVRGAALVGVVWASALSALWLPLLCLW